MRIGWLCSVAVVVAAGCGSSPAVGAPVPAATVTVTAAPSVAASPTPTPTASSVRYASPLRMIAKAKAALPFLHDCDTKATYNVYGSLSASCFGRSDETVYFDTFDDPSIGAAIAAGPKMFRYHVADGWSVSAENPRTLAQVVAALK